VSGRYLKETIRLLEVLFGRERGADLDSIITHFLPKLFTKLPSHSL
jgi:hypothetical protein